MTPRRMHHAGAMGHAHVSSVHRWRLTGSHHSLFHVALLLRSELGLLLRVRGLCGSLCLLVLLALALIDGLCHCLTGKALLHLRTFTFPRIDRSNQAALSTASAPCHGD